MSELNYLIIYGRGYSSLSTCTIAITKLVIRVCFTHRDLHT